MSGHSKWSQIKRQKQAGDKKKGLVFSKLANAITIAVRQGGGMADPVQNFRLRLIIDRAKQANMPKENITRAIERANAGQTGGLIEVQFEGYGPGGVAILIEAATDNRARTLQEVKNVFDRTSGTLAGRGAVSYMFTPAGMLTLELGNRSLDDVFSMVVESGADDLEEAGDMVEVYTKPDKLHQIKEKLTSQGLIIRECELISRPNSTITMSDKESTQKIIAFVNALEELEDVQKVFANFIIPDELLS